MTEAILIRGSTCCGKTTLARVLRARPALRHVAILEEIEIGPKRPVPVGLIVTMGLLGQTVNARSTGSADGPTLSLLNPWTIGLDRSWYQVAANHVEDAWSRRDTRAPAG